MILLLRRGVGFAQVVRGPTRGLAARIRSWIAGVRSRGGLMLFVILVEVERMRCTFLHSRGVHVVPA